MDVRGIRGAVTEVENSKVAIAKATQKLMLVMVSANKIGD